MEIINLIRAWGAVPTYTYSASSPIDKITFKKTEGAQHYAYLHAGSNADSAVLHDIICAAQDKGWQATPHNAGGEAVLQIQGCRKPETLISLLTDKQAVKGQPVITQEKTEEASFVDKIKKRSLGASGLAYLLGDISFATYGYKSDDKLNIAAGALYGAGTLALLGFGRKDQSDLQIKDIAKKLAEHVKAHGNSLPKECSIDSIIDDKNKGLIKRADDLFRRYPSELMNLFFAAAGACIAISAHKALKTNLSASDVAEVLERNLPQLEKKAAATGQSLAKLTKEFEHAVHANHKLHCKLDIGLGAMTGASGLFAMVVNEKKPDPDAPAKHGLEWAWEQIQAKPLAIAGAGYMVSTLCHAASTVLARKYANNTMQKSVPWRTTFVVANIVAEILVMISSKGHGAGVTSDKSVDETVFALAADLIVKQPKKMQEPLIDYIAGFLGHPEILAMNNEEARKRLHGEVERMRQNPWAMAMANTPPQVASSKDTEFPAWQIKTSHAAPAAMQTITP